MGAVIIDYGSGNLRSAANAFRRAAGEAGFTGGVAVSDDPEALRRASHIVLPGVGAYADCRRGLDAVAGMVDALEEQVIRGGKPFLGICVGMQLMATVGREFVDTPGLGWIPGPCVAIDVAVADPPLKIPHIGWNELTVRVPGHPLLDGIVDGTHVYFVHSFHVVPDDPAHVLATTDYGRDLAAVVGRDNLVGTQFHPEKSQKAGLRLIANFLAWTP